jgi:hypothetical protein
VRLDLRDLNAQALWYGGADPESSRVMAARGPAMSVRYFLVAGEKLDEPLLLRGLS